MHVTPSRLPPPDRLIAAGAALFVAVFGFLPIVNWIPDGRSAPSYPADLSGWINGTVICVGVGVVLAILSRRFPALWRPGLAGRAAAWAFARPAARAALLGTAALALYVMICFGVFDARPLLIDEVVQLFQARVYATGHLTVPLAAHPEFFANLHMVEQNGRLFAQFPPGHPVLLMLGELAHTAWLVVPVTGAAAAVLFARLVRAIEPRPTVALGATLLFAFAPFMAFMSGSYMSHVPALALVLAALVGLERLTRSRVPDPGAALAVGLGFGAAAAVRPLDAFAFAFPAAVWLFARLMRARATRRDVVVAGLGVLLPMLPVMWVNVHTTGAPLRFGYEVLWGKSHALGFHASPWGPAHTPARGLELVSLYFLRLQSYLFETPVPSLVPAIVALALTRHLSSFDRYLLASSGLLVGLYFAYWHDGLYLGPRFVLLLMPALALWSARALSVVAARAGQGGLAHRTAAYTSVVALVLGGTADLPLRVRQYRGGFLTMRWNADAAAERAGVRHGLVLVREAWGAERIARMWALGLTRPETEHLYPNSDPCIADRMIDSLERAGTRGPAAYSALERLLVDSTRFVKIDDGTGIVTKVLPGVVYTAHCHERQEADRHGFTLHLPLLLARWGDNVYARDLHARDTLLLADYPGRPLWILRPPTSRLGEAPRFVAAPMDSLRAAWRDGR